MPNSKIASGNKVQHVYHDHLHDTEVPTFFSSVAGRADKTRKGPRGGVATPFPVKLHNLLESNEFSNVISWQPHGRCFTLNKPKEFIKDVMPRHFRQTKLTSFQRQLNLYCFIRLTSGRDKGCYYHELFLRGKPQLCERMIRMRIKGTKIKASSNPETEPNFYAMSPAPPRRKEVESEINAVQNHQIHGPYIPQFNFETTSPLQTKSASRIYSEDKQSNTSELEVSDIELSESKFNSANNFFDPELCVFEGQGFHYLDSIVSKYGFQDESCTQNLNVPSSEC